MYNAIEAFNNNYVTDTGFMNIIREPVGGAIAYKLGIYTGYWYEYINVGNVTSFNTKDTKWLPTTDELDQGIIKFHWDKSGRDFLAETSIIYMQAKELGFGYNDYSNFDHYWVRLIAVYPEGDNPESEASFSTIPEENEKLTL